MKLRNNIYNNIRFNNEKVCVAIVQNIDSKILLRPSTSNIYYSMRFKFN